MTGFKVSALIVAASLLGGGTATAQTSIVDPDFIGASCSGAAFSCAFTVQQTIARLRQSGVSEAALNAQIGRIAAIVSSQVSAAMPVATRARIAEALTVAAVNTTDPDQQAGIQQAAETIEASPEGTVVTLPPFEGSPT